MAVGLTAVERGGPLDPCASPRLAWCAGTVARQDIAAGELYLDVPWKFVMNEDSIRAADAAGAFDALRRNYDLRVGDVLLFFLLKEMYRPPSDPSFWQPYVLRTRTAPPDTMTVDRF